MKDNEARNEHVRNKEVAGGKGISLSHNNSFTCQWVRSYFYGNENGVVKSFSSSRLIHEVVSNADNHFMNH